MLLRARKSWEIGESAVTPEAAVLGRRGALGLALGAAIGAGLAAPAKAAAVQALAPMPAARNPKYTPGRAVNAEQDATTYNNYYEFSTDKNLWQEAQALKLRPWTVSIGGMVAQPQTIGIDDLIKQMPLEERIYRHRCVEAWAMTVPWTGFALSALLKLASPQAGAKFVVFETAQSKEMPGLAAPFYPWPYIEALTMEEAGNDLAFMVTGMYGHAVPPQNGAPLRLAVPWKYGFKSAKSIVKISFTDKRPQTFWEAIQPAEYGFWANVNPQVPHPRWSQASERLLGSGERVPTQIYNGYGEFVAPLYAGKESEKLFM
jgi:sulfoxide reductase catalytic subunit YedY